MVYGLVAAAVVALVALGLWVSTQQKLAASNQRIKDVETDSESKIQKLNSELSSAEASAASASKKSEDLKSEKLRLSSELETAESKLAATKTELTSATSSVDKLTSELDEIRIERDRLETSLTDLKQSAVKAQEREAAEALNGSGPIRAATLWDLELSRSARTWRTSVATNPDIQKTPFDDAENPVRTAVEIEAAALREDVGASVRVDWKAGTIDDPARCHLVLRLAQEMMATAAREASPTKLTVEGDDEVSLQIEPDGEADDSVITLSPPKITSDLITASDRGLIVTLGVENSEETSDQTEAVTSEA